jgi:hypothetical protein
MLWSAARNRLVAVVLLLIAMGSHCATAYASEFEVWTVRLIAKIPPRQSLAMLGSEFADHVAGMEESAREMAILDQLLQGNIPEFLQKLKPVRLHHTNSAGKVITSVIFVMPDYLAVGSDEDFFRIPMSLNTAVQIAARFGFILPTTKMVDAIYAHSEYHFKPQPMSPGSQMRSTAYYLKHNRKIKKQRLVSGISLGDLVSGHKKDVVFTNRLNQHRDRIAIYGWHRPGGRPIQPLSCVHDASYADYSHGIRLVSEIALINGNPRPVLDVLEDSRLAIVLSSEGVLHNLRQIAGY